MLTIFEPAFLIDSYKARQEAVPDFAKKKAMPPEIANAIICINVIAYSSVNGATRMSF